MHVIRGSSAELRPTRRDIFTGEVESHSFVDGSISERVRMSLVRFRPGGRTRWHQHPYEQILVVTEGRGIVATEGREHVVGPGDIVIVAEGEKHWHGATETTAMTHLNVNGLGEATVLEAVDRILTTE